MAQTGIAPKDFMSNQFPHWDNLTVASSCTLDLQILRYNTVQIEALIDEGLIPRHEMIETSRRAAGLSHYISDLRRNLAVYANGDAVAEPDSTKQPSPASDQWLQSLGSSQGVIQMVRIPAGSFVMGSPINEPDRLASEGPQHEVRLEAFSLSRTPITQAQWQVVAGWPKVDRELNPDPAHFKGPERPVEQVSWHDAMEFCRRLSQRTGCHYTLPSEAQWEYACRAGTTTPFAFGETLTPEHANYSGSETIPVGSFPPNRWGLHDMHGNVWEWCEDHWHGSYEGAPDDGTPWLTEDSRLGKSCAAARGSTTPGTAARPTATGSTRTTAIATLVSVSADGDDRPRLLRGGSWYNHPRYCRSAYRGRNHPGSRDSLVGFRVCCLPQD